MDSQLNRDLKKNSTEKNLQVLEVVTRVNRGLDLDALSILNDGDLVTQVALQSIDLKVVLEELLESSGIEDLVVGGLLAVDNKLALDDWSLLVSGLFDRK